VFDAEEDMSEFAAILDPLRRDLDGVLNALGFRVELDRYHPEAFGSRTCEWRRGAEAIRVLWDGKERWLLVEYAANLLAEPMPPLQDILLVRQEGREGAQDLLRRATPQILAAVQAFATRLGIRSS
jgi:hypothetical protein